MNKNSKRNFVTWLIIIFTIFVVSGIFDADINGRNSIIFSDFLKKIDNNEIESVDIRGTTISGKMTDGRTFSTMSTDYPDLIKELK